MKWAAVAGTERARGNGRTPGLLGATRSTCRVSEGGGGRAPEAGIALHAMEPRRRGQAHESRCNVRVCADEGRSRV